MGYPTKIATCCYCGTRAALILDKGRHELTCASCGAPLHDMKKFRQASASDEARSARLDHKPHKKKNKRKVDHYAPERRKPYKKRKGLMRDLFEEVFDVIEDIFD